MSKAICKHNDEYAWFPYVYKGLPDTWKAKATFDGSYMYNILSSIANPTIILQSYFNNLYNIINSSLLYENYFI